MKEDKALRKVLAGETHPLPFGFEMRIMERVAAVSEKKSQRSYYINLAVTTLVSVLMLAGTLFTLNYFYSFNIFSQLSSIEFKFSLSPLYISYIFLASLILLLLVMDYAIRQTLRKSNHS